MITWIIIGYLALSLATSLVLYAAYMVAARADGLEQSANPYLVDYPTSAEQKSRVAAPAVAQQLVLNP